MPAPLSQAEMNVINGNRVITDNELIAKIQRQVAPLPFKYYDSLTIGQGQNAVSRGWYDNWADFANTSNLRLFLGRDSNVDTAYANITTDTADFAIAVHALSVELWAPTGDADRDTNPDDTQFVPELFSRQLPAQTSIELATQNNADQIITLPLSSAPAGVGTSQPQIQGAASLSVVPGNNGVPVFSNQFVMNTPFWLPAKSTIQADIQLGNPIRDILRELAPPGFTRFLSASGEIVETPKVYMIRVGLLGKRFLQLRGARTA